MIELYPITANRKIIIIAHTLPSLLEGGVQPYQEEQKLKAAFILENGRLHEIRPLAAEPRETVVEPGWNQIVLPTHQFLVPAFVDCHLHLALDGVAGFSDFTTPPPPHLLLSRLRALTAAGVLTVRDGGDRFGSAFTAQKLSAVPLSSEPLPKIVTTGPALFRQGHYGSKLGGEGLDEVLSNLEQEIRRRKTEGAQQLKVILSGLVSMQELGKVGPIQFSLAELEKIVHIAAAYELPVMAHASSDEAVQLAVRGGVHSVEHGYFVAEETLREMAAKGVAWVPTLAPLAALAASMAEGPGFLSRRDCSARQSAAVLRHAVEQQLLMLGRARALGVNVAVGTDGGAPGVSWPEGYWMELKLLAQAGFTPAELLTLGTVNGAVLLGLAKERGRIAIGKRPYWLCLDINFLTGHIERKALKGIIYAVDNC